MPTFNDPTTVQKERMNVEYTDRIVAATLPSYETERVAKIGQISSVVKATDVFDSSPKRAVLDAAESIAWGTHSDNAVKMFINGALFVNRYVAPKEAGETAAELSKMILREANAAKREATEGKVLTNTKDLEQVATFREIAVVWGYSNALGTVLEDLSKSGTLAGKTATEIFELIRNTAEKNIELYRQQRSFTQAAGDRA